MDRHTIAPYPLRLTPDMRQKLSNEANENGRSLHGEILQRLKESLKKGAKDAQPA